MSPEPSGPRSEAREPGGFRRIGALGPTLGTLGASLVSLVALGLLFLHPYVSQGVAYPLGGGAPKYVARSAWVAENGLDLVGTIRVGGPLLVAGLMHVTGKSALTLLAVVPASLTAIAGLAAAALLRGAFSLPTRWVPVIAFLSWSVFAHNGIIAFNPIPTPGPGSLRFDNLVNVPLVLGSLGAAIAYADRRKGAVAATVLLMAAGLAHWPFYAFALGVFVGGVVLAAVTPIGLPLSGWPGRLRRDAALLAGATVSAAFVGLTLLARAATGWVGLRPPGELRGRLRAKLFQKVARPSTFLPFPSAAAGAVAAVRTPGPGRGRRLFLAFMAAWVLITVAAVGGGFLGIPTGAFRLLYYFFPASILSALLVWRGAVWLAGWVPGKRGTGLAALLVTVVLVGTGLLTAQLRGRQRSEFDRRAIDQTTALASYLAATPPPGRVVVVLDRDVSRKVRGFQVIQAALPPHENARTLAFFGPVGEFLSPPFPTRARSPLEFGPPTREVGPDPVVAVLERFNPAAFDRLAASAPDRVIAPGVFLVRGVAPLGPVPQLTPPAAEVDPVSLVLLPMLILVITLAAGGGWAIVLLPPDRVLRVLLAPALGIAAVTLALLGWDRLGFSFARPLLLVPMGVAAVAGWTAASWRRWRSPEVRDDDVSSR